MFIQLRGCLVGVIFLLRMVLNAGNVWLKVLYDERSEMVLNIIYVASIPIRKIYCFVLQSFQSNFPEPPSGLAVFYKSEYAFIV